MRKKTLWLLGISLLFLILVTVLGIVWEDAAQQVDFARKNLPPGTGGLFGTDWMGRNMLKRTVAGLSLSIRLGLLTAAISAAVALALALLASLGGGLMDSLVCGLINLVMGIPHMLLLILISYSLGKGFRGVAAGIALTHWASLARLLRAEILQIRESPYVQISEKLGKKPWWIAWNHIVPQVSRQFVTGLILLFPHAILHESGLRSFLRATGDRCYFIREYVVPDYRKMVAGALSGRSTGAGNAGISGDRAEPGAADGSGERA